MTMVSALTARRQGDDYQSRYFWWRAADVLDENIGAEAVGFELKSWLPATVKGFDDIALFYPDGYVSPDGEALTAEYFQLKFHVTRASTFTWRDLIDPAFINAERDSLLKNLLGMMRELAPGGIGIRCSLVTPSMVAPGDRLNDLLDANTGALRLATLRLGKTVRSWTGEIREAWMRDLGVTDPEELFRALALLRIRQGAPSLQDLAENVSARLPQFGFAPMATREQISVYEAEPWKRLEAGHVRYDAEDLKAVAKHANLWNPRHVPRMRMPTVGIRSFARGTESMPNETALHLCLLEHFVPPDYRIVRSASNWQPAIIDSVKDFARAVSALGEPCYLRLDCHQAICVAAGALMHPKYGFDVTPLQSGPGIIGAEPWTAVPAVAPFVTPLWDDLSYTIDGCGPDVAVALGVAQRLHDDVRDYVTRCLPSVGRVISLQVADGANGRSVRDAAHALQLADDVAARVRARSFEERGGALHLFVACPKSLAFFLGRCVPGFGRTVVYEYDFASMAPAAYATAITFPL